MGIVSTQCIMSGKGMQILVGEAARDQAEEVRRLLEERRKATRGHAALCF